MMGLSYDCLAAGIFLVPLTVLLIASAWDVQLVLSSAVCYLGFRFWLLLLQYALTICITPSFYDASGSSHGASGALCHIAISVGRESHLSEFSSLTLPGCAISSLA